MRISVRFTSQLRALAGVDETAVELPDATTVDGLVRALREPFPAIFPLVQHTVVMVNHKIATQGSVLRDGDEVMFLQLLGGG